MATGLEKYITDFPTTKNSQYRNVGTTSDDNVQFKLYISLTMILYILALKK